MTGLFFILSLLVMFIMPWPKGDFTAYHHAAVKVSNGENPYHLDELGIWYAYRYPPVFVYSIIPLGLLEEGWAGRIWFVASWAMLAGCLVLSLSLLQGPRPYPAETSAVVLLTLFACSCYSCHNLFQGQVALPMFLACLGWAVCQRARWHFSSGLLLAAGCALKLAPIVLLPYLVIRKDWRGLAGVVLGGLVFFLVPAPWVGVDGCVRLHQDWFRHAREVQCSMQNYRTGNQGLLGMLSRLPPFSNGSVCYSETNMAELEKIYPFIVAGFAAMLYSWILWDRRARSKSLGRDQQHQRENLYLILLFIFMTLSHPAAWRCNFIFMLFPCIVLAQNVYHGRPGNSFCRVVLILVGMAWVWPMLLTLVPLAWTWPCITAETTVLDILTGKIADTSWSTGIWLLQGAHFWVALLVGAGCWWISGQNLRGHPSSLDSQRRIPAEESARQLVLADGPG